MGQTVNDHEGPLLIYPIGDIDENPAEILTFEGIVAVPVKRTGPRRRRADVTIKFFKLNDREELRRERSRVIVALGLCLATMHGRKTTREARKDAAEAIDLATNAAAPHSSCATAFVELYRTQRSLARQLARAARNHLQQVKAK